MRKPKENAPGADMIRMAQIEAELQSIQPSGRKGVSRGEREAVAEPLRRELTHLKQKLWGDPLPPDTLPE
jgi:hypothetical protein